MFSDKESKNKKLKDEAKNKKDAFEGEDEDEDDVEQFLESVTNKFKDDDAFDDEWDTEAKHQDKRAGKCRIHSAPYRIRSAQYRIHSAQYRMHSAQYRIHSAS